MTVVKINALEIPADAGPEIVKRFTARMGALADVAGFEGFELLRPTGEAETRWFVYTRWLDQASYEGWRDGQGAREAHAGSEGGKPSGGQPSEPGKPSGAGGEKPRGPVSMGATLLEFEVEVEVGPSGA